MEKQRTLLLLKPDAVVRQLVGRILARFEDAGLKVIGMKMLWIDEKHAGEHYQKDIAEKHGERVRNGLIKYIKEGPVIALVLEGVEAIAVTRKIVGSTYPNESPPGTIRGDFAHISKHYANAKAVNVRNLIHASENEKDAKREISLWFSPKDLHTYKTAHDRICFGE